MQIHQLAKEKARFFLDLFPSFDQEIVEKFSYHLRRHIPDLFGGKFRVPGKIRTAAEIHRAEHQYLIHGKDTAPVTKPSKQIGLEAP